MTEEFVQSAHHHAHTSPSQKDRPGQLLAVITGDLGFQLDKPDSTTAKEVYGLDVDPTQFVWGCMERVIWNLLGR